LSKGQILLVNAEMFSVLPRTRPQLPSAAGPAQVREQIVGPRLAWPLQSRVISVEVGLDELSLCEVSGAGEPPTVMLCAQAPPYGNEKY